MIVAGQVQVEKKIAWLCSGIAWTMGGQRWPKLNDIMGACSTELLQCSFFLSLSHCCSDAIQCQLSVWDNCYGPVTPWPLKLINACSSVLWIFLIVADICMQLKRLVNRTRRMNRAYLEVCDERREKMNINYCVCLSVQNVIKRKHWKIDKVASEPKEAEELEEDH